MQDGPPLRAAEVEGQPALGAVVDDPPVVVRTVDRKSTRLNSSHGYISYAVFCLKKKTSTSQSLITIASPLFSIPDTVFIQSKVNLLTSMSLACKTGRTDRVQSYKF